MSIKKGIEIKLNVRPVYIGFVHLSVFEGPCRFGKGDELETEYDMMMNQELYKVFKADVKKYLNIDEINLMDPVYVERYDDLLSKEDIFEKMAEKINEVDLYFVSLGIARGDILIEFAKRYKKPVAVVPENLCMIAECISAIRGRNLEGYGYLTWEDAIRHMKVLRVRKVLQKTNVLLATRLNSTSSMASDATFICLEDVTRLLGTGFRYINAHELIDQTQLKDPRTNHTIPGRVGDNIDKNDMEQIETLTDELMQNAVECNMDRDKLLKSVKAFYTVKKLMDIYDCNAFSIPCPDICATRRLNDEQITFCLTHSLLNELGIPSACEYDIGALVSMQALMNISGKAPYMGNTNPILYKNGEAQPRRYVPEESLKNIKEEPNLYFTWHSTPNRRLKGFDKPESPYGIQPFAYSGFGATLRHDFNKDCGQPVTMMRFAPDCRKMFVAKGVIKGGGGFSQQNCTLFVIFQVQNQADFFAKQIEFGNHIPLVYGDYTKELAMLGDALGLEVVTA